MNSALRVILNLRVQKQILPPSKNLRIRKAEKGCRFLANAFEVADENKFGIQATKEPGDQTFGIAVFRASGEAAARKFIASDPAVVAKLMTAELHSFSVHLQRKKAP